jgi:hypothetical protein
MTTLSVLHLYHSVKTFMTVITVKSISNKFNRKNKRQCQAKFILLRAIFKILYISLGLLLRRFGKKKLIHNSVVISVHHHALLTQQFNGIQLNSVFVDYIENEEVISFSSLSFH